jgi:nicotinamidase-related amidase
MRPKTVLLVIMFVILAVPAALDAGDESEREEIRPVLVVMDVQNIWIPRMSEADRESAPQKINESIALFRKFGLPVIPVYHSDPQRGPEPGTEPFEFPSSIDIEDGDPRIVKAHPSAFTETNLESLLREGEHNTVVLCGLSAVGCVLATYFGAMDRGFTVLMVEDALLSHDASYTDVIEDICYSVTIEELEEILENPDQ